MIGTRSHTSNVTKLQRLKPRQSDFRVHITTKLNEWMKWMKPEWMNETSVCMHCIIYGCCPLGFCGQLVFQMASWWLPLWLRLIFTHLSSRKMMNITIATWLSEVPDISVSVTLIFISSLQMSQGGNSCLNLWKRTIELDFHSIARRQ